MNEEVIEQLSRSGLRILTDQFFSNFVPYNDANRRS